MLNYLSNNYHSTLQAVAYLKQKFSKHTKQSKQKQQVPPQIQKTITQMKFRRAVIAVLVCNRLKKRQIMIPTEYDLNLITKLNEGLSNSKQNLNRSISSQNVDEILSNLTVRESLIKIFNSKDYFNQNLF